MILLRKISQLFLAFGVICVAAPVSVPVAFAQGAQRNVEAVKSTDTMPVTKGAYYALVIGNNDYQILPKLGTAVNDAQAVEKMLREEYGFGTTLLLNATREKIIAAFSAYRQKLPDNSHLLIYYAGHGNNDTEAKVAYWLPVDAHPVNSSNWISAEDITAELRVIKSLHILVVSDSCYSGELSRGIAGTDVSMDVKPSEMMEYIAKLERIRSRDLLASGGNEPVADAGGVGGHSIFASVLLQALSDAGAGEFTTSSVFQRIVVRVAGRSTQKPVYSSIINSSDLGGGDFIFLRQHGNNPLPLCCMVDQPDMGPAVLVDAKQALAQALQTYCSAYQSGDVDTLRNIWPSIGPKKIKDLQDFLHGGRTLSLDCKVKNAPEAFGETVAIDIEQNVKFFASGKAINEQFEKARMKLKKAPGSTAGDWKIEWIQ